MNLILIEKELQKRLNYPYIWGRKQNNSFDYETNYIYNIFSFDELLNEIKLRHKTNYQEYFNYAINRWFNFWSAFAVEKIFCLNEGVSPALNSRDRLVDFTLKGIKFDHKTSVFPKGFNNSINYAISNPEILTKWLYTNQSQQQRKHLKNRLFIVLYDSENFEHWKLKANISWLKTIIDDYVDGFDQDKLITLNLTGFELINTDVIWAIK